MGKDPCNEKPPRDTPREQSRREEGASGTRLRPHHVLCAHFFVGKGYSEGFVEHMRQTLEALDRPGAAVTLIGACDELCAECPNNRNGVCETDGKVRAIDRRAAEAMELQFGDTLPWEALYALAGHRILEAGKLREVCGDCEWVGLCGTMTNKNLMR